MPFWVLEEGFWPLAASKTLEVKNNHAYVKTPGILNKYFEFFICRMYGLAVMLVVSRPKLHPSIPIVV